METIEKHPFLLAAVERLRQDLGGAHFTQVDYWDGDLLAQGLARPDIPNTLVYILLATELVGDSLEPQEGLYCYQCEIPSSDPNGISTSVDAKDGVEYDALLAAVRGHLAIP